LQQILRSEHGLRIAVIVNDIGEQVLPIPDLINS
jgi:G3E family GTPase